MKKWLEEECQRRKVFKTYFPEPKGYLSHKYGFIWSNSIIENYDQAKFENRELIKHRIKIHLKGKQVVFYSTRTRLPPKEWRLLLEELKIPYITINSYKELPLTNLNEKGEIIDD